MALEAIAANLLEPLVYASGLVTDPAFIEAGLIGGAGYVGYRRAKK